jgi:Flp pilus assembly protein TadD
MSPRLQGLTPEVIETLKQSSHASDRRDAAQAVRLVRKAAEVAPDHPEVLRRLALALVAQGPSEEALTAIGRAVAQRPDDGVLANAQAIVLQRNGQPDAAIAALGRAHTLQPESVDIAYHYGRALTLRGDGEHAVSALERVIELAPTHRDGRATLALALGQLGRSADAIAQYRVLLEQNADDIRVWSALAALKSARFDEDDLAQLERIAKRPGLDSESNVRMAFTLAKACDDNARYAEAFGEYRRGNALMRERIAWDARQHSEEVGSILRAFASAPTATDPRRGVGVVFIVSLPRSGSTLTEQILASHPQVSAGDERTDLLEVIAAEGRRRGMHLAAWAPQADAEDWRRLGENYLARIAPLRGDARVFTDKLPGNWLWLGAAFAMLPGARAVECRRDPVETAWSCFRQAFGGGGTQDFSYDLDSIAAFMHDFELAMRHWRALYPRRIHTQVYEALQSDMEMQTRELLAFCDLDFDPACLRFHENRRHVRTMSAAQVREPLRRDTAQAARYGELLDPLRAALVRARGSAAAIDD